MDSGEKLCLECLQRSLLKAFRRTLREATLDRLHEYHTLEVVYDTCVPHLSLALILLASKHLPRIALVHRFRRIKLLIVQPITQKENKNKIDTHIDLSSKYLNKITNAHNATLHLELVVLEEKGYGNVLVEGAQHFLNVLEAVLNTNDGAARLILLPYTPDYVSQWLLGATFIGLTRAILKIKTCKREACIVLPLTYTSQDYTTLAYLYFDKSLRNLEICNLIDKEILKLQHKSPEYIYSPLKLLKELYTRLYARRNEHLS